MSLTVEQRLKRLQVRLQELQYWRIRQSVVLEGWTIDGQPIALGEAWPDNQGSFVFAADGKVPADWPLEDVVLSLDLGGESLITIVCDGQGSKSYGLDPYHQEFPLSSRSFHVSSETVARLPFGEPVRKPHLNRAALIWIDRAVDRLWLLMRQISEAVDTLAEHDVVPYLLEAAEEAFYGLDWPSASASYVARTASAPLQQKIWQLPSLADDPAGLDEAQRASVTAAYDALMGQLETLQHRFPPQGEVGLTGHAHIDLAWLWPYRETRRKLRRTFHTTLDLMEKSDDFRFNQSTAHYYAQLEQDDPALLATIQEKARAGQWETVGGMWIEPDTNMPTGESLSRQVLYGQRYFEKMFGVRHKVCWLPDCFGFSGALPQLLKQGGIKNFFTIKVNWSETNHLPADLFWWEGLDGSRVLTHTFDNPMHGYNGFVQPDCIMPTWRNFKSKDKHHKTLLAVGYGDGGGGVTPEMLMREEQLRVFPTLPKARWTKVHDFFADIHANVAAKSLTVWKGEIYLELHRATLTSQSAVKKLHRQAERGLITAETVASLAHMLGAEAPHSREQQWRVVLKNEFHDILPGSSIAEVYEDARIELTEVIQAAKVAQDNAMDALASCLPAGSEEAFLVVNPSLSPRRLDLPLEDGQILYGEGSIAPLGVAVIAKAALRPAGTVSVTERSLENDLIKVTLADDGSIASLLHKPTGREAVEGGANRLFAYTADKPREWDAWDVEEDYTRRSEEISSFDSIQIVRRDSDCGAIRIVRSWRNSTITQELILAAGSPRLDIRTELDWHDRRVFLRSLNGTSVRSMTATCECAYGVIERPTHTNRSWDQAMFEASAHRFADLSQPGFGVALLNDAKYGHSIRDNILGLSLLRSPIYPDPLADEGLQSFTYALLPHEGTWYEGGVREEAESLNQPLLVKPVDDRATGMWQPLSIGGIDAALSTLKPAEDIDGLIFRVYEPAGRKGAVHLKLDEQWHMQDVVTIMEEKMETASPDELLPFEVKSWHLVKQ